MSKKKKRAPYWKQTLVAAPVFGAKALLGDLPKGAVEHAVQRKVGRSPKTWRKLLGEGLRGRGGGRAIGGGIGILTAPAFLRGLELAGSDNKKERAKGLGLIGLSSSVFATQKGGFEGYRHARVAGSTKPEALRKGLTLGLVRSGYKLPAAIATGLAVAAGRKKNRKGKRSPLSKFLIPAATGALAGAAGRSADTVIPHLAQHGRKGLSSVLRKVGPAAAGGGAGGLLGGIALAGAVDQAAKMMKKHAADKQASLPLHLLAEAAGIGATHQTFKGMLGFGTIGKAFSKIPGLKQLQKGTHSAESRHLAIGIREGLHGKADVGWRGALTLGATMPEMIVQRRAGQALGKMLRNVPESQRVRALEWLQRGVNKRPGLHRTPSGDSTPVFGVLSDAIDKATGKKGLYKARKTGVGRALQRGYERATLGGRGVLGDGLPRAAALQRPSLLRRQAPNAALGAVGTSGAVLGAMAGGALPMAAGTLGMHAGFGGIKGMVSRTPFVQGVARRGIGRGLIQGALPGVKNTGMLRPVLNAAGETILTPALRDSERVMASIGRTAVDDVGGAITRGMGRAKKPGLWSNRLAMSDHQKRLAAMSTMGGGGLAVAKNYRDARA
jgi:hypothetical protein